MVIRLQRRTTQQTARKATAHAAFAPATRRTSLLALRMITDIRRGSRLADESLAAKCGSRGIVRQVLVNLWNNPAPR